MPHLPHFGQPLGVVLSYGGGLLGVLLFVAAVLGHQIGIRQILMYAMHPFCGDFFPWLHWYHMFHMCIYVVLCSGVDRFWDFAYDMDA